MGRARKRLHELLEDSFSLFGSREPKPREFQATNTRPSSAVRTTDALTIFTEGRSVIIILFLIYFSAGQRKQFSSYTPFTFFSSSNNFIIVFSPTSTPPGELNIRPRTSASSRINLTEDIPETGQSSHTRGTWGSRPLSAGPFHKPNLPEVDTRRILTDSQLPPEDPAVPLISSIKKELEKFSPR